MGKTINLLIGPYDVATKLQPFMSPAAYRALQGHNHFPRHISLRGHGTTARPCFLCNSPSIADAPHMVLECPSMRVERTSTLGAPLVQASAFHEAARRIPEQVCQFLGDISSLCRPFWIAHMNGASRTPRNPNPHEEPPQD